MEPVIYFLVFTIFCFLFSAFTAKIIVFKMSANNSIEKLQYSRRRQLFGLE
jgi:hypothetical protein